MIRTNTFKNTQFASFAMNYEFVLYYPVIKQFVRNDDLLSSLLEMENGQQI